MPPDMSRPPGSAGFSEEIMAVSTESSRLIAHILDRYHEVHRQEFPIAIRLARRVEATHSADPCCPKGLADHLLRMIDELESHQRKEEEVLFPMILGGGGKMIQHPIGRMLTEHREVEDHLQILARLTRDHTAPAEACASWRELCAVCRKLDADLREHLRLEEELYALFMP